jgi:type II secretory pathway pseudopilin PulG
VRPLTSERGITIIETTVILSVLFILAGAMSPIVAESVNTARAVKAKNDASMIAMAMINFEKDLGSSAVAAAGANTLSEALGIADVLASDGTEPQLDDPNSVADDTAAAIPLLSAPGQRRAADGQPARQSSRAQRRRWRDSSVDSLDDHLTTNRHGYRYRRPGETSGWNGPYISAKVKGDPWGNQYLLNSRFLDGGSTAADAQGRPRRAVYVVSAGANGVIETPFEQPITDAQAYGDDIVIRIQ